MTGAVVEQLTFQDRAKVVSDHVFGRSKTAGWGTPSRASRGLKRLFGNLIFENFTFGFNHGSFFSEKFETISYAKR